MSTNPTETAAESIGDLFECEYCGGRIEAYAPLWARIRRRPDGTPALEALGAWSEDARVSCADCDMPSEYDQLISDAMRPVWSAISRIKV
ncbi:hypothetical protein ACFY2K_10805 [Kitasatospora sp. NPDC001309]|uniref:hypothetical protein n=1 Tax=Kitasatospora sp. NPDC001309 TaxID=3364013 RepID=UPI0036842345